MSEAVDAAMIVAADAGAPPGEAPLVGLNPVFRKTKRKTEGPQHFAFPEISRENAKFPAFCRFGLKFG